VNLGGTGFAIRAGTVDGRVVQTTHAEGRFQTSGAPVFSVFPVLLKVTAGWDV